MYKLLPCSRGLGSGRAIAGDNDGLGRPQVIPPPPAHRRAPIPKKMGDPGSFILRGPQSRIIPGLESIFGDPPPGFVWGRIVLCPHGARRRVEELELVFRRWAVPFLVRVDPGYERHQQMGKHIGGQDGAWGRDRGGRNRRVVPSAWLSAVLTESGASDGLDGAAGRDGDAADMVRPGSSSCKPGGSLERTQLLRIVVVVLVGKSFMGEAQDLPGK